jgi:hypothetical protein
MKEKTIEATVTQIDKDNINPDDFVSLYIAKYSDKLMDVINDLLDEYKDDERMDRMTAFNIIASVSSSFIGACMGASIDRFLPAPAHDDAANEFIRLSKNAIFCVLNNAYDKRSMRTNINKHSEKH